MMFAGVSWNLLFEVLISTLIMFRFLFVPFHRYFAETLHVIQLLNNCCYQCWNVRIESVALPSPCLTQEHCDLFVRGLDLIHGM